MKGLKLYFVLIVMGYVAVAFGQGNWELLHPHLTANQLVSVDFVDADNGLAVGDIGTILKTTDSGESWQKIPIPWTADLRDVDFVTSDIAYIIGESGIIIKSNDGGYFWQLQPIEFTNTLNRVRFYDANEGWIVGINGLILRTINGGESWNRIITEHRFRWFGIDFASRNTWVLVGLGNKILRTTDSGLNWERIFIEGPDYLDPGTLTPQDVFFLNRKDGWIGGKADRSGGTFSFLCKTTDGGASWQLLRILQSERVFLDGSGKQTASNNYAMAAGIQQIHFENKYSGTCLSGPESSISQVVRSNVPYHTNDGGESWCGKIESFATHIAPRGRFCFLTPEKVICTYPGGGFITSYDGGTHWHADDFLKKGIQRMIVGNDGILTAYSLRFDVFAPCGADYDKSLYLGFKSTDYGKTWQEFYPLQFDSDGQSGKMSHYINTFFSKKGTDTVWGIEHQTDSLNSVYTSDDFGLTWHYLKDIYYWQALKGIYADNDTLIQCGFLVQKEDDVPKFIFTATVSTDDGQSTEKFQFPGIWNEITRTCSHGRCYYPNKISGYHFFNSQKAFVVGSDGNIVMTRDGCRTWENISSGVSDHLQDIHFINERTGYIVGNFGRILKTEDGGVSWKKTNSGTQNNIYSIVFENELIGWAGTSRGLLYTSNGGESWEPVTGQSMNGMVGYLEYDKNGNLYGYYLQGQQPTTRQLVFSWDETTPGGFMCVKKAGASQVADGTDAKPKECRLYPNYPNPFNSNTMIQFALAEAGEIELAIYNIQGKRVRQVESGYCTAGSHTVRWDGRDQQGQAVSSGVYVIRLTNNQHQQSQKILLLQ